MRIILMVSTLFFIAGCTHKMKDNKVSIQLKVMGNAVRQFDPPGVCHSVQVDLVNNTDSLLRCWIMSCSWTDNFIFNSDSIMLYIPACDGNEPIVYEIKSGGQLTLYGESRSTHRAVQIENLKLGFVLIREHEYSNFPLFDYDSIVKSKITNKKDIIWCDPIKGESLIKLLSN